MTRRIIASLAAAGVAILASCSQDQRPSALLPTEASLAKVTAPTCSFTTITSDAKNIFVNSTGTTKDPVFALIDAMSAAYKIGGADGATSAGFDVLRRYGDAFGTTAIKSTVTAAALSLAANDVLLCMTVPGFTYSADQFTRAFGPTGLFAVRSTADAAPSPALAHSAAYGVEATSGFWPLTGSASGKALFYAAPVSSLSAQFDDPLGGPTVIDIKSLPAPLVFDPKLRIGFCDASVAVVRLLHVHAGDPALVLPESNPTFCTGGNSVGLNAPSSTFASAVRTLGSFLAPKPAYAASRSMMFAFFGGGTVGGLSEIGPIQVQDTLFINTIPNASVSDTIKTLDADTLTTQFTPVVTVRALTMTGMNPIGGATITLSVIGNKGSFLASGGVAVTDLLGYARFPNLSINKAGGYTISAKGEFGTSTSVSNLFNINGQ